MAREHDATPDHSEDDTDAVTGLGRRVWTDLHWLHAGWMELAFPRQREPHPELGRWRPSTASDRLGYRLWGAIGVPVVALAVTGLAVRFHSRRLARVARRLGYLRVLLVVAAVWGGLVVVTYLTAFPAEGVRAVAVGGFVAAVSAVVAAGATRWDGRVLTVLVAFPFGVTTLFLPPVAAALFSPTLGQWVFPNSDTLAVWLLDNVLSVGGLAAYLRAQYQLAGVAYLGMWFGIAVPVGWVLGSSVTLADRVQSAPAATGAAGDR